MWLYLFKLTIQITFPQKNNPKKCSREGGCIAAAILPEHYNRKGREKFIMEPPAIIESQTQDNFDLFCFELPQLLNVTSWSQINQVLQVVRINLLLI